jgi:hypothetical protein
LRRHCHENAELEHVAETMVNFGNKRVRRLAWHQDILADLEVAGASSLSYNRNTEKPIHTSGAGHQKAGGFSTDSNP